MTHQVLKACIFMIGLQKLITKTRTGIIGVSQRIVLYRELLTMAAVFQEVIQLLGKEELLQSKNCFSFSV